MAVMQQGGISMTIPVWKPARAEMLKRTAHFKNLKEVNTGVPDMEIDGYRRSFFSVMDFAKPKDEGQFSPSGSDVVPAIIESTAGYGVAYIKAQPGNGVMMHNHDTNESFLVMEGTWTVGWEGDAGKDQVVLEKYDFITMPPHVYRDFYCVTAGEGKDYGLMMAIVIGTAPEGTPAAAEFSPEAKELIAQVEMAKQA
jgi:mannose-6-phosphate isomerase-like protein (cupin superfamily)